MSAHLPCLPPHFNEGLGLGDAGPQLPPHLLQPQLAHTECLPVVGFGSAQLHLQIIDSGSTESELIQVALRVSTGVVGQGSVQVTFKGLGPLAQAVYARSRYASSCLPLTSTRCMCWSDSSVGRPPFSRVS